MVEARCLDCEIDGEVVELCSDPMNEWAFVGYIIHNESNQIWSQIQIGVVGVDSSDVAGSCQAQLGRSGFLNRHYQPPT